MNKKEAIQAMLDRKKVTRIRDFGMHWSVSCLKIQSAIYRWNQQGHTMLPCDILVYTNGCWL